MAKSKTADARAKAGQRKEKVLEALCQLGGRASSVQVARAARMEIPGVCKTLRAIYESGQIRCVYSRGRDSMWEIRASGNGQTKAL